ncbi:MAG: DNA repair exonuclease [Streptococcaceae bacterium]|jgi:DNA repair exonuclease SbcCD nuclease subunit|nr:DNA repair exonuclease [Streptococcaceae bacterium]
MIRFLHTADLHIDRAFEGVRPTESLFTDRLLVANKRVLENIVKMAIKFQVDFIILAGDTFHQSFSSPKVQRLLIDVFQQLFKKAISVFMIFGNHDYYNKSRFWFRFPKNVFLFTKEEVVTTQLKSKNDEKIAISAFSYENPWISERKILSFPKRQKDVDYHLGIYHGEMGGDSGRYAPFSLQKMQEKNYDYWALGHIHYPKILDQKGRIRYAGAPIGHTRKEKESRSVNLVEINKEVLKVEQIRVATLEFQLIVCDINFVQTMEELRLLLQEKLESLLGEVQQFVDVKLINVNEELVSALNALELIEFFNSLYPLELSISDISWQVKEDVLKKSFIPFKKEIIEKRFEEFVEQNLLKSLSEPLTSKRGVEELLEIADVNFQKEVYEEAKRRFYSSFELIDDKHVLKGEV